MKRSPILRNSAPKKTNPARRRKAFVRVYHSPERVSWVKQQPCICKGRSCDGEIENAHVKGGGVGRKAGHEFIVPLCRRHHRVLHVQGVSAFEGIYGLDLEAEARITELNWRAQSPIEEHTPNG